MPWTQRIQRTLIISDLPPHPLAAKHAAIPTCWYLGGRSTSRTTVPYIYPLPPLRRHLQRNTATQHKMMCLYICDKNRHSSTIFNSILKSFIFHWNWGPSLQGPDDRHHQHRALRKSPHLHPRPQVETASLVKSTSQLLGANSLAHSNTSTSLKSAKQCSYNLL